MHEGRILGAIGAILAMSAIVAPWTQVTWSMREGTFSYGESPGYIWQAQWATFGSAAGYTNPRDDLYAAGIYVMFLGIAVLWIGAVAAFLSRWGGIVMLAGLSISTAGVLSASGTYVHADSVLNLGLGWGLLLAWFGVIISALSFFKKDAPDAASPAHLDEGRLARGLGTR